jgi:hypothetical protein
VRAATLARAALRNDVPGDYLQKLKPEGR